MKIDNVVTNPGNSGDDCNSDEKAAMRQAVRDIKTFSRTAPNAVKDCFTHTFDVMQNVAIQDNSTK